MRGDYVYMLLILLLPLLPAFILFWFLPSSADVQGPLKGLKVKLGGAFGGYIVGVLLSWQVASSLLEPTWSDNWNVVAHVKFDGTSTSRPNLSEAVVLVHPPIPDIDPGGLLQIKVPIPRIHIGAIDIQRLIVAYDGYETVTVPLDPDGKHIGTYGDQDYHVTFDARSHQIVIQQPIVLTKAAP